MTGRVFICTTCNRYAPPTAGEATPGERLASVMKAHAIACDSTVAVRAVQCLNGCPHPCTAALRMPGKMVIRFSDLTVDDAPALLEVASRYALSCDGNLPVETLPACLQSKISDRVISRPV